MDNFEAKQDRIEDRLVKGFFSLLAIGIIGIALYLVLSGQVPWSGFLMGVIATSAMYQLAGMWWPSALVPRLPRPRN